MNQICLPWTQLFASFKKINPVAGFVANCLLCPTTLVYPGGFSLLQGSSWMALTNFALGERDSSTMQANATANITE